MPIAPWVGATTHEELPFRTFAARDADRHYPRCVREEVRRLVALGPVPDEADPDAPWDEWQQAAEALPAPATDEEAETVLTLLPADEGSGFGIAWPLLHFVETAPGWPLMARLDDSTWWLRFLRERAQRGKQ